MKKILMTGSNGMLAYDFIRTQSEQFTIIGFDKEELDITNSAQLDKKIQELCPDVILNCAAYTNVDEAEDAGKKANFDINTLGTYYLAKIAKEYNIDFITISTDYVFDGKKENGYHEEDVQNPINSYGFAKYLGEKLSKEINPNSIIIRTSWLYGGNSYTKGEGNRVFKNFVNTMLKLSENKSELNIIDDQFGSPTYTVDLSDVITQIIEKIEDYRGQIFHLSNETPQNGISWYDFACEIFKISKKEMKINPCTTEEYKTKAIRPKFSKLNNNSAVKLRYWRDGLQEYLR